MATTLEIQEKLNKLLEDAEKIAENLSRQYREQANLLEKIAESTAKVCNTPQQIQGVDLNEYYLEVVDSAELARASISSAMDDATRKTGQSTESTKKLDESIKSASESAKSMDIGSSILGGIGKAFSFAASAAMGFLSMLGSIGSALFSVAKAAIGLPLQILDGLIGMAQSGGGSSELAEALREIRVEFGYLDRTAGRAIINLSKNMSGELANTGLRVSRVFGNLAERLKYFTEYAKNLGETVDAVFNTLEASSAEALGAYNKALGFTAAGQKGVAQRALATGQDLNEINRQVANFAVQLSDAFGVTMKLVSRDVGEMMADFEHFGNLSVQEMTQAAVFARKLGIEVKSLGKLVDKFLNFEDAANSAAQLSQAFGLNVDAFKLMSEQDPAKKMQMLRDSFFAAGKTIENMTAQERRLLATQTGLSESELSLAFSQKSRGLSYDQIKKKGDAAQKSQLSQEQVLEKLSGAIERLVKSGEGLKGGFFDMFIQGFVKGIQSTKEFRDIMRALSRSLAIVFRAGIEVGRMFVALFPGIRDVMEGIRDMFNPRFMTAFMNKVKSAFREFFTLMTTNPTTALPVLLERLQSAFTERFSASGPGASKIFEGIKKFLKAVFYMFLGGIREGIIGLGTTIAPLLKSIFSDQTFDQAAGAAGGAISSIGSAISTAFTDVFGTSGSPQRQAMLDSLDKFAEAFKDALFFIGIKLVNAAADLIKSIGDIMSGRRQINQNTQGGAQSMSDKFLKTLMDAFDRIQPSLFRIGEKIMEYIGYGLLAAIGMFSVVFARGFFNLVVGIPVAIIAYVSDALADIVHYITFTIPQKIINAVESVVGKGSFIGNIVRGFMSTVALLGSFVTGIFRGIAGFFINVGQYFDDFFTKGPARAFENFVNGMERTFVQIKRPIIAALNSLISTIPASWRNFIGLSQIPLPPLPPANNPAVQAVNQAVQASRTGGAEINRNLTESLTLPTPAAATAAAPTSVSEQVSNIRETLQSATEVGRIDQQRAVASFEKLQEFASNLGPILSQTQTAFNTAFQNVDINKINETTTAISGIIQKVNEIRASVSGRNLRPITNEQFEPLKNSMNTIANFLNSSDLTMIGEVFSAADVAARVSGIETTANSISQMVEKINATSQELASLQPVNIQSNLSRLATNLGLGNNATYTIQNRNFTVTVNVDVHMDARELENTLIERKGTRIQHTPG